MKLLHALAALLLFSGPAQAVDAGQPLVLELFTSQGCSSCPPADELLRELAKDPAILPLSLHVHYWDYLGWKDPFASPENTERQRIYAQKFNGRVYTPQLVVNGIYQAVGSNKAEVAVALEKARARNAATVPMTVKAEPGAKQLRVHIGKAQAGEAKAAIVYAVRFLPNAMTQVRAGENGGRTLISINNVTQIKALGPWKPEGEDFVFPMDTQDKEEVAVFLQEDGQGNILGAARYRPDGKKH